MDTFIFSFLLLIVLMHCFLPNIFITCICIYTNVNENCWWARNNWHETRFRTYSSPAFLSFFFLLVLLFIPLSIEFKEETVVVVQLVVAFWFVFIEDQLLHHSVISYLKASCSFTKLVATSYPTGFQVQVYIADIIYRHQNMLTRTQRNATGYINTYACVCA